MHLSLVIAGASVLVVLMILMIAPLFPTFSSREEEGLPSPEGAIAAAPVPPELELAVPAVGASTAGVRIPPTLPVGEEEGLPKSELTGVSPPVNPELEIVLEVANVATSATPNTNNPSTLLIGFL